MKNKRKRKPLTETQLAYFGIFSAGFVIWLLLAGYAVWLSVNQQQDDAYVLLIISSFYMVAWAGNTVDNYHRDQKKKRGDAS